VADDVDAALRFNVMPTVLVMPPPVSVIVALFAPTEAVAVFTLTVMLALLEAEVGLTVSQPVFSLTLQLVLDVTATV
jgi:hypothetical protein